MIKQLLTVNKEAILFYTNKPSYSYSLVLSVKYYTMSTYGWNFKIVQTNSALRICRESSKLHKRCQETWTEDDTWKTWAQMEK